MKKKKSNLKENLEEHGGSQKAVEFAFSVGTRQGSKW